MRLCKVRFLFELIDQFSQVIAYHHLHNFYCYFPVLEFLEIAPWFQTNSNYYKLCSNLNNNFGVFNFIDWKILTAGFLGCKD